MKNTLITLILALCWTFSLFGQSPIDSTESVFSGTFNAITINSNPTATHDYSVTGFFNDFTGKYSQSGIDTSYIFWDMSGQRWEIDSIDNGGTLTIYLIASNATNLSPPKTGIGAIIDESQNYPVYVSGVQDRLNNIISRHFIVKLNTTIQGISGGGGGTVTTNTTLTGDGTSTNPLGIAQQGALSGQVLKWTGTTWSPANDDYEANTDNQVLSVVNIGTDREITISNGNTVVVSVADNDNSSSNEIQDISTNGTAGNITISSGSTITLNVDDADASVTNEIQTMTGNYGITVTASGNDYSFEADTSKLATQYDISLLIPSASLDTELELEAQLTDVTNVYTNNDGNLTDDDLSDNNTDQLSEGTTNLYFTDERVDDRVAALLQAGTNITLTYNDAANTLTISSTGGTGTTGSTVTVVTDYTALSTTTVTDTFLLITDPGHGGLFARYFGTDAVDEGVIIQDAASTKFERIRDNKTYYKLCWWDESTYTGSEIFQKIFNKESNGGIKVDISRYDSPRSIVMDRDVDLVPNLEIFGRGDTLYREATPVTTLTAAVTTADNILNVSSSAGFKVNQDVFITYAGATSRHDGSNWGTPKRITAIPSSTQIQIQGTAPAAASIGDTVIVETTMFLNGNALELERVYFHDIVFDGNWTNNPYTNDWGVNNTIRMANQSRSFFRFDRCTFRDIPTENVIVASMTAEDIQAENLAGGIFHCSVVMDTAVVFKVYNTWGNKICQATNAVTGHSEAAFITSASPYNIHLENVEVYNCKEAFVGDIGPSASGMEIINCKAVNCKTALFGSISTGAMERLNVIGNDFIDCNYFGWTGGTLKSGQYVKNLTISNNRFIGTFLNFDGVKHLEFTGNTIAAEKIAGSILTNNWTNFGDTLTYDAALYLTEFQDVVIANNNFSMDNLNDDLLRVAIMVDAAGITSNTNTDFIIAKDLLIHDNNFGGFVQTIMTNPYNPIIPQAPSREVINWRISNNTISIADDNTTANKVGILGLPGTLITDNTVYAANDTLTGTQYPIIGYGIHGTTTNPREQRLMGTTITNNRVYGIGKTDGTSISIFVGGNTTGNTHGRYNVICRNNTSFSDIKGNGADTGNGYIINNINYTNTLTNMTARQNPPHDEDY